MKLSQLHLKTMKQVSGDVVLKSHRHMLQAGMIDQLASGLYTWTPFGLRILRKFEAVVRRHMDASGALELLMPIVQPADIWHATDRYHKYGAELFTIDDRHDKAHVLGPTHEEVIASFAGRHYQSYKDLPVVFYQIQTKFRDEIRPRYGVMRSREFLMKDAYSFAPDAYLTDELYVKMEQVYRDIFSDLGLTCLKVEADSGAIGGAESAEFHVVASAGEDDLVVSGDRCVNIEAVPCAAPSSVEAPNANYPSMTIGAEMPAGEGAQVIWFEGKEKPVAVVLSDKHSLNEVKLAQSDLVNIPLRPLDAKSLAQMKLDPKYPDLLLGYPIIADSFMASVSSFFTRIGKKYRTHIAWHRDYSWTAIQDVRNICTGELSPDLPEPVSIKKGIEVGHIFKLGTTYAEQLNSAFKDQDGSSKHFHMGCYGIGISRLVAAYIEQHHVDNQFAWHPHVAPFSVVINPICSKDSTHVYDQAVAMHDALIARGCESLLDDRGLRPGAMFADAELIGAPFRLVLSERLLAQNTVEFVNQKTGDKHIIAEEKAISWLLEQFQSDWG